MISKQKLLFSFVVTLFCFLVLNVNKAFAQIKLDENGNENFVNTVSKDTSLKIIFICEREATIALEPIDIERKFIPMCCRSIPAVATKPVNTRYIIARESLLNPAISDLIVPMPRQ